MSKQRKRKNIFFIILPIALGVFLIWFSLNRLSSEDVSSIKNAFKSANYWWVLLSLILGFLSHLSRAYRWKFLLEPMGYKPKLANSFMAVMSAYLLNIFVPRSGEFARAAAFTKYEGVPFEKSMGTIVSERVADVIMLLSIIMLGLFFQTDFISSYLTDGDGSDWLVKATVLIIIPVGGIICYKLMKRLKSPLIKKVVRFVDGLLTGAISIFKMKHKWPFVAHTLFIWVMYVLMFYVVALALPETSSMTFEALIVGFVAGSLSMLTNGGLGTYPVFVAAALILYQIDDNAARAFGWIMWSAQTLMVIVLGAISFFSLPFYNKDH